LRNKTYQKIEKSGLDILDFFGNFQTILNQNLLQESPVSELLISNEKDINPEYFDEQYADLYSFAKKVITDNQK